jgi:hypothetical protein
LCFKIESFEEMLIICLIKLEKMNELSCTMVEETRDIWYCVKEIWRANGIVDYMWKRGFKGRCWLFLERFVYAFLFHWL